MKDGVQEANGAFYSIDQALRDMARDQRLAAEAQKRKAQLPRARECRCENPWVERDPDLGPTCLKCSRAVA